MRIVDVLSTPTCHRMKSYFSTNLFTKAGMPFLALILASCGGGNGEPAEAIGTPPSATAPGAAAPGQNVAGTLMRDCFTVKNPGSVYYFGARNTDDKGNPLETGREDVRFELVSNDLQGKGSLLLSSFVTDGKGGFTKNLDQQDQIDSFGRTLKPIFLTLYAGPGTKATETTITGAIPLDLTVGETREYVETFEASGALNGVSIPTVTGSRTTKITLLAIEPVQTVGKQFPFSCKIETRVVMISGKPVTNYRLISWYVPNFRAVKSIFYNADVESYRLELTRIVSAPTD